MVTPLKPAVAHIPPTGWSDHSLCDVRSLALNCKIAYKISQNPSLLDTARVNLKRWCSQYEPVKVPLDIEWWQNAAINFQHQTTDCNANVECAL